MAQDKLLEAAKTAYRVLGYPEAQGRERLKEVRQQLREAIKEAQESKPAPSKADPAFSRRMAAPLFATIEGSIVRLPDGDAAIVIAHKEHEQATLVEWVTGSEAGTRDVIPNTVRAEVMVSQLATARYYVEQHQAQLAEWASKE